MSAMPWQEKLAAIIALTPGGRVCLRMRQPGNWYVEAIGVELKEFADSGTLLGTYGNGVTPEDAVDDHWQRWTEIQDGGYLVTDAFTDRRACWRWNGFRWVDITLQVEPKP